MLNILVTPKANEDLKEIFEYTIETWSFNQAEKYQNELNKAFLDLCSNPKLGELYLYKSGNFRNLRINRHLIFYKHSQNECTIVRILHEQMDLKKHLP